MRAPLSNTRANFYTCIYVYTRSLIRDIRSGPRGNCIILRERAWVFLFSRQTIMSDGANSLSFTSTIRRLRLEKFRWLVPSRRDFVCFFSIRCERIYTVWERTRRTCFFCRFELYLRLFAFFYDRANKYSVWLYSWALLPLNLARWRWLDYY